MLRYTQLLLFSFIVFISNAQNFGGSPASIKWRQINTDSFKLVFPAGYDSSALRIANIIAHQPENNIQTIGGKLKKISVFIRPQTTISNGYVMLGPWRSELYTTPAQNALELGAIKWTDLLAIHEYRHVEQYSNFNNGLSKTAKIIFGEYGQAIANGASIPDWFAEGDAVYNETLLSEQGRGRLPFFFQWV